MVYPLVGAAFLGGSVAGLASRHVGTLNVLSLSTGLLSGVWLAQNYPENCPNLKQELRRFAAVVGEAEREEAATEAHWTRGAVPLDPTILGPPVMQSVSELRAHRRALERADQAVSKLFAHSEETRAKLTEALGLLEAEKRDVLIASQAAHEKLAARLDELKAERRSAASDRERTDYFLTALRELRDLELGPMPQTSRSRIARYIFPSPPPLPPSPLA
ncbi:hypothetical protein T492DRAFT_1110631 [Pavlovales sp. CCMP2436]|nr:hypothetical protein T492DRAFT_1110631 [Pavlovales sp. CCMP2436]|mmetsp:Transcript_6694/g.17465  ORF Transcript_6694/g.17465 Transcript_6694/m.17465 type:complete len:218 (-) Transcript_6694:254-907(-)